jgi:plastocyanin
MKRPLITIAFAAVSMLAISCAQANPGSGPKSSYASATASASAQPAGSEIKIDNFSFTPATLTVPVGTKVTWTNHDDIPHNIVSSEQKFKSKAMDTDDSFSNTFNEAGTYEYFCGLHPKMVGRVIVEGKR